MIGILVSKEDIIFNYILVKSMYISDEMDIHLMGLWIAAGRDDRLW